MRKHEVPPQTRLIRFLISTPQAHYSWVLWTLRAAVQSFGNSQEVLVVVAQNGTLALRLAFLEQLTLQQAAEAYKNLGCCKAVVSSGVVFISL